MIHKVIVWNPFDVKKREEVLLPFKDGSTVAFYCQEPGQWTYSINGVIVDADTPVPDESYLVIMPLIEGKALGVVLSIGFSVLTGGIASGAIFSGLNMVWRTVAALAIGMIGNAIISKFTAVKPDMTNTEQSNTYGWGGPRNLTGQGYANAITYGRMKNAGVLLSRHVISDGEKQYLNLLYCAGEGELDAIEHIRINENPIDNYKDVTMDIRLGTNNQTVIPNFNDSYADQPLNYELTHEWSTHQVQGEGCQAIEVTLSLPQGLYYSNDSGGMSETFIIVEAEYRGKNGSWKRLPLGAGIKGQATYTESGWKATYGGEALSTGSYTIRDKTNKAIYRTFRFDGLPADRYEVRIRCSRKEGHSIRYANRVYWAQLTQIIYDDFIHPGKALVGIRALATEQLSGTDPTITWEQERKYVYVWNPYIGAYEKQPATNPAWACYDMIHQCRRIGNECVVRGEHRGRMNYDAFKGWAKACEEKDITFNYIFDTAGQLWEQLKIPEAVGRGKVLMQGTRFTCVYDYATLPTQLFTVGNIKKDSFKEEFQAINHRANAVEISFLNREKNYERDVIPVYADDYDSQDTLQSPVQIELMGCTTVAQAYRHGKHHLRANKYEVRTCTFEAFQDAIACTVGDVILVQHDMTEWGEGGRILKGGKTVILDRVIHAEEGATYTLLVRDSKTDLIDTLPVLSIDGNKVTVTKEVEADSLYSIGRKGKEAKPFRVMAIGKGMNETTRKITCIEYYPDVYSSDDGEVPQISYTDIQDSMAVHNLTLNKAVRTEKDGTIICDIAVSWLMPRGRVAKEIRIYYKQRGEREFTAFGTFDGSVRACIIPNVSTTSNYTVKVVCVNDLGVAGRGEEADIYIAGKEIPPVPVTGLIIEQDKANSSIVHVSWKPNPEADIQGYRIYDKEENEVVHLVGGTTHTVFIPISGTYIFGVKAVDTSGNVSTEMAWKEVTLEVSANAVAVPDSPQSGFCTLNRDVLVVWDGVNNTYVDYYEVRTNRAAGEPVGLLGKTTDLRLNVQSAIDRRGEIYVFAHNPVKGYSQPLCIPYNFKTPPVPKISHKEGFNSFTISVRDMPPGVRLRLYIGQDVIDVVGSVYTYIGKPGNYTVRASYFDFLGEGPIIESSLITIRKKIPNEYLEDLKVSSEMLDEAIQNKLSNVEKTNESVTNIISTLNGNGMQYSAIAQLAEGIALKANKNELVSLLNLSPDGVKIDGRLIQIDGDTVFGKDVDIRGMLNVENLSTISANIGVLRTKDSGARLEIRDNLIVVYDDDNNIRLRLGVWADE